MRTSAIHLVMQGVLILLVAPTSFAADDDELPAVHLGVDARPITRAAPRYPRSQLRRGQQGWVQLSYVVSVDGEIVDPVVENSSGSEHFEKEAVRAVKKWTYEPATWDGEPVQQCHTQVMITFALDGEETSVTWRFRKRYQEIEDVINGGDLMKAQSMTEDLVNDLNLSLSETAWLWALRARLAGLAGDKNEQLLALRKATESDGRWVDKKLYPDLLFVRTALEVESGNYSKAMSSHDKLVSLDDEYPRLEQLQPFVSSLRDLLASDQALSVPAAIGQEADCVDCTNNWNYRPLRRKFSIADIDGSLRNIEFRCSWRRVVDKVSEGITWELPEDWGACSIVVFGEPGTSFDLLELPST